jgi:3-deoxy-D-manno-octulosonate 8-phosphate phosphatase (KDO 8-P phosphatase)
MSKARAKKIKLLIFDVDGVLTDGKLYFLPAQSASPSKDLSAPPSSTRVEVKGFHAHDGAGITMARLAGIKTGLITKRVSETVAVRARDLRMEHVHQGIHNKWACLEQILKQEGLKASEAAFVGDDVIDLPVMRRCGLAVAVANARPEVKKEAHYVTPHAGGDGAARDAIEFILKGQGKWKKIVEDYTAERK